MHIKTYILSATLLASTTLAGPGRLPELHDKRALMKRNFWCNGVDSEDICPQGETMVPMNEHACDVIAKAGRIDDITPAKDGESSVKCPEQSSSPPLESTPFERRSADLGAQPVPEAGDVINLRCVRTQNGTTLENSEFFLKCTEVYN